MIRLASNIITKFMPTEYAAINRRWEGRGEKIATDKFRLGEFDGKLRCLFTSSFLPDRVSAFCCSAFSRAISFRELETRG